MVMNLKRFYVKDEVKVYDYQEATCIGVARDSREAVNIVNMLNRLNDEFMQSIDHRTELNEQLTEAIEKYENILGLIDIRIKENNQLALLHYPEPEDKYINQYESRAYELEQLKKLIIQGNNYDEQ